MATPQNTVALSTTEFFVKYFGPRAILESVKANKTIAFSIVIVGGGAVYSLYKKLKAEATGEEVSTITRVVKRDKISVDKVFLRRLYHIGRIVIPSVKSTTFAHLVVLTILLYARTVLSLKVADITGTNAQYIVQQNLRYILLGVIQFGLIGLPASLVNSALKYETTMLSLKFRKNLTDHVHAEYLRGTNFYKASNLGGQARIDNADQRVTQDIQLFSEALSNLYATIFKPLLDVVLNTLRLSSVLGWRGPVFLFLYYFMSGAFKRFIMPAFGRLTARASELEGDYRTAHQRLISNAEEIAFYDGGERERNIISRLFSATYFHARHFAYLQYLVGIFDEFLVKYGASITGYAILALPVIEGRVRNMNAGDLTNEYVRNRQLLINLAKGIAQLVVLSNKVTALAGYTARVSELLEQVKVLDEIGVKPFEIVEGSPHGFESSTESSNESFEQNERDEEVFLATWRQRMEILRNERRRLAKIRDESRHKKVAPGSGRFEYGEIIKFEHVTIVNPDGRLLVEDLNFEVPLSTNVVVTGPNGSGKSSLFRVLGELWPLQSGVIIKPGNEEILFVPQKPYLVLGTLRDQIIYPHSVEDMKRNGVTDADLERLLALVDPPQTILNQWDWDDVRDWFSAFSGGQKQRVGMARLFYHCPKYGILDECTSAVSVEVEGKIYETCEKLGITLFTVSHRASLRKYHKFELHFNGSGGWSWSQIKD